MSVLAIGAPRESTEIEYRRRCEACGEATVQRPEVPERWDGVVIRCRECDGTTDEMSL